jgi:hypothetical protein
MLQTLIDLLHERHSGRQTQFWPEDGCTCVSPVPGTIDQVRHIYLSLKEERAASIADPPRIPSQRDLLSV